MRKHHITTEPARFGRAGTCCAAAAGWMPTGWRQQPFEPSTALHIASTQLLLATANKVDVMRWMRNILTVRRSHVSHV
eukprot:858428-Pleurochrysis_carterae.AAC.3